MSTTCNYATLIKLLPTFRNLVDRCGEVTLTSDEADKIRTLGLPAEEGRWRVPPVPPELVRDNPLLEHLSIGWGSRENKTSSIPVPTTDDSMKDSPAVQHMPARGADTPGPYYRIRKAIFSLSEASGRGDSEVPALASKILEAVKRNRGGDRQAQVTAEVLEARGTGLQSDFRIPGQTRFESPSIASCDLRCSYPLHRPLPNHGN